MGHEKRSTIFGDVAWTDTLTVEAAVQRVASHSAHALRDELGAPTDSIDLAYTTRIVTANRRQLP